MERLLNISARLSFGVTGAQGNDWAHGRPCDCNEESNRVVAGQPGILASDGLRPRSVIRPSCRSDIQPTGPPQQPAIRSPKANVTSSAVADTQASSPVRPLQVPFLTFAQAQRECELPL
jgi:hypothetical protein